MKWISYGSSVNGGKQSDDKNVPEEARPSRKAYSAASYVTSHVLSAYGPW